VKKLEPLGGTNIDEALQMAFQSASGSEKAPLMVVFMKDGRPTVGETEVQKILARADREREAKKARIFVLGVGDEDRTLDLHLLVLHELGEPVEVLRRGRDVLITGDEDISRCLCHHFISFVAAAVATPRLLVPSR
jgi:hypothetical protein